MQGVFVGNPETWLERVYKANGKRETLDALYDEWESDYY